MSSSPPPVPMQRVLIFAPSPFGGLSEHVHYQASELVRRGFAVTVLCRRDFAKPEADAPYHQERRLLTWPGSSLAARLVRAALGIANWYILAWRIVRLRPAFVVLEANTELHASLWFLPLWLLRLAGVLILANFHDPVRGPEPGQGRGLERLSRGHRLRLRWREERKVHARDWRTFVARHAGAGPLRIVYSLSPWWRILRTPRIPG